MGGNHLGKEDGQKLMDAVANNSRRAALKRRKTGLRAAVSAVASKEPAAAKTAGLPLRRVQHVSRIL